MGTHSTTRTAIPEGSFLDLKYAALNMFGIPFNALVGSSSDPYRYPKVDYPLVQAEQPEASRTGSLLISPPVMQAPPGFSTLGELPPLLGTIPPFLTPATISSSLRGNSSAASTMTSIESAVFSSMHQQTKRPRSEKKPIPEHQKDANYYEKRKRNNQAAKKSRDARKMREDHIAFRVSILDRENVLLRAELMKLRDDNQALRQLDHESPEFTKLREDNQSLRQLLEHESAEIMKLRDENQSLRKLVKSLVTTEAAKSAVLTSPESLSCPD